MSICNCSPGMVCRKSHDVSGDLLEAAKLFRDIIRLHAVVPSRTDNPAGWDAWNEALATIAKAEGRL